MQLLAAADPSVSMSPQQLVECGMCDPVRLFVKNEPHTQLKISQGRFRLISSVSLVDQLVERLLFGPQNSIEIDLWDKIPSKPGMGLSLASQASSIWSDLKYKHTLCPAAEADISGFDWSVQDWELAADVVMRIQLGGFKGKIARAAINRFRCLSNAVFQLSNGTLIEQGLPGLMKSGSYCTSSSNSRIRCLMAELIGAPWYIAMGDDSVEGFVSEARQAYGALGHLCKDYIPCEMSSSGALKGVNFCSHKLEEDSFYLTTWPKSLYRYLSGNMREDDLAVELRHCPAWPRIERYIRRLGRVADKDGQEKRNESEQETQSGEFSFRPCYEKKPPSTATPTTNSGGCYAESGGAGGSDYGLDPLPPCPVL